MLKLFSKLTFSKKKKIGTLSECQTGLDPDQDRYSVGSDLGPKMFAKANFYFDLV